MRSLKHFDSSRHSQDLTSVIWVKAHAGQPEVHGLQCMKHPPIREMIWSQIVLAQIDDMGRFYSRQRLHEICKRLGVEKRGKKGPPKVRTMEEVAQQSRDRVRFWYEQKMATEEGREFLRARQREKNKRRSERMRKASEEPT